mmetsp:Transcript_55219/g.125557  ORF Transcript_55219/g.125557 Transcript_55219/m.125557 type:complete len:228 (+) Transcript_55219:780-1463(+)
MHLGSRRLCVDDLPELSRSLADGRDVVQAGVHPRSHLLPQRLQIRHLAVLSSLDPRVQRAHLDFDAVQFRNGLGKPPVEFSVGGEQAHGLLLQILDGRRRIGNAFHLFLEGADSSDDSARRGLGNLALRLRLLCDLLDIRQPLVRLSRGRFKVGLRLLDRRLDIALCSLTRLARRLGEHAFEAGLHAQDRVSRRVGKGLLGLDVERLVELRVRHVIRNRRLKVLAHY